jgi:P27 family predicted phage terminase small subunit
MKGRKPQPTALRILHGNPSEKRLPQHEPDPQGDLYAAPAWLSDEQRESWVYAIEHSPARLLKCLDRGVLATWVCAEAAHKEAAQHVAAEGTVVVCEDKGVRIQNPYLRVMTKQAEIMMRSAQLLGFAPAVRPRIEIADAADPEARRGDELDRLLDQRPNIN